jgi:hypothetical protein
MSTENRDGSMEHSAEDDLPRLKVSIRDADKKSR